MPSRIWGAHPFVWTSVCCLVALCAISVATTVLSDPRGADRRTFLRHCHDQAFDRGVLDRCVELARTQFGRFDSTAQSMAYVVAAIAVFAGTSFVLMYVVRQIGVATAARR